jgi:hypothetical protein
MEVFRTQLPIEHPACSFMASPHGCQHGRIALMYVARQDRNQSRPFQASDAIGYAPRPRRGSLSPSAVIRAV